MGDGRLRGGARRPGAAGRRPGTDAGVQTPAGGTAGEAGHRRALRRPGQDRDARRGAVAVRAVRERGPPDRQAGPSGQDHSELRGAVDMTTSRPAGSELASSEPVSSELGTTVLYDVADGVATLTLHRP